jgi:Flp pilus assembly protein TadG
MTDPDQPVRQTWVQKRHAKMAAEIARNRRGEYTVPTWVLAVALLAIVGAWVAVIVFS